MLILSRKTDEEIVLGNDIVIKITEISRGSVKIGIDAPKETAILRGELKEKIERANKEAAAGTNMEDLASLSRKLGK
ncbi:MAG TPA: carbon storage regulator [Campylobacteraceae bacterium]|nr:carbon storage regulator [Campylobacteraceae bacterium]